MQFVYTHQELPSKHTHELTEKKRVIEQTQIKSFHQQKIKIEVKKQIFISIWYILLITEISCALTGRIVGKIRGSQYSSFDQEYLAINDNTNCYYQIQGVALI